MDWGSNIKSGVYCGGTFVVHADCISSVPTAHTPASKTSTFHTSQEKEEVVIGTLAPRSISPFLTAEGAVTGASGLFSPAGGEDEEGMKSEEEGAEVRQAH